MSPEHSYEASGVYPRVAAYCNMLLMVLAVDSSFRCFVVYLHRKHFLLDLSQLTTPLFKNKNLGFFNLNKIFVKIPVEMTDNPYFGFYCVLLCFTQDALFQMSILK